MADDVVDTIAQYDLDDDFPDYANEQNKELNQIVSTMCCHVPTRGKRYHLSPTVDFVDESGQINNC
jgi:hypothetical protein